MSIRKRIAITAVGSAIFFGVFFLIPQTGRWGYIGGRLRNWRGQWEDWVCLAISLGVTMGIAIVLWGWTDGNPNL